MKKKIMLAILIVLAAVSTTLGACVADGADKSGVYGSYYVETANGENRVTLSEDGFVFKLDSYSESGMFTYDGSKIFLDVKGETGKVECVVENNVMSFTYKGTHYVLYKEVENTVSYNVDGNVTTVKSMNGKKVTKPAAPVKSGYAFIGWYLNSDYKTPYRFDTVLTGDITLYARFIEVSETNKEFTATLIDGEGNVAYVYNTAAGKLYDLPELEVEGKTFLGWWVSDYQNADKLTYKYSDETLASDTNLYAVYSEKDDLAVSVKESGITWVSAGVNKSYSVVIKGADGGATAPVNVGSTSYKYDFTKVAAGDYVIEVTVDGKTSKAYYKNKALARVCSFEVVDFVLSFVPVENAQEYYITVVCGDDSHEHDLVANGTSTYYNFKNCVMCEDGIKFYVTATAGGYASSVSDAFVLVRNLDAVGGLTVNTESDVVTWEAVKNATNYTVEVTVNNKTEKFDVGAVTEFSLKNYGAGDITVKVTATAKGYNNSQSAQTIYNKKHISAPTDIKVIDNTITFKSVAGATSYIIKIGNVEKTIAATAGETVTFKFTDDCFANGNGGYYVSVKAVAGDNDSAYTEETTVIVGDETVTSASVVYENGLVKWSPIVNAKGYKVKVNGVVVATLDDGSYSSEAVFATAGENTVEVVYISANNVEKTLASTKVTVYAISFDAQGGNPVATIYKATGDKLELTDSQYRGYTFKGWYNAPKGTAGTKYVNGTFNDAEDVTLYAVWEANEYSVHLDYCGVESDNDGAPRTATVTFGEKYSIPMTIENPDETKRFAGWYSQPEGQGERYTNEKGESIGIWDNAEDGRTLYAGWLSAFTFNEIDNGKAYSVSKGVVGYLFTIINVPETYNGKPVTTVEGSAFQGCYDLVEVNIPDTIKLIESSAFNTCSSLMNVNIIATDNVDKGNYSSINGVLINNSEFNGVELKYFPMGRTGEYVIPDVVTTIPKVFNNTKITKITIPASVTAINSMAFYYCRLLTTVVFEPAPEGVEEQALTISADAFKYCASLTSITLPSRITKFNKSIFSMCNSLKSVNIKGKGGEYTSKDGVLCNADGTEIIYCPVARTGQYTVPSGVTAIGNNAFEGTKITSLVIPAYVTKIGDSAFNKCESLKTIDFKGKKSDAKLNIGSRAFYNCTALKSVTLPENLYTLEKYAFGATSNLIEVTVNSGNVKFENAAFGTATTSPVYYVEKLNIGADLCVIDINGIFGGTVLSKVTVNGNNANYSVEDDVIFNKLKTKIVYYPTSKTGNYVIPESVVEIGSNVFENKLISKITIGKNIALIGDFAFAGCENLTEIIFIDGDAKLSIGNNAFQNTAITGLTLPSRTAEIGEMAFADCVKLESVSFSEKITEIKKETFAGCKKLKTVTLPANLTAIGENAFAYCTSIESIVIPAKVTKLGEATDGSITAFAMATSLKTITVDDNNAKYSSKDGVLYGKDEDGVLVTVLYCPIMNTPAGGKFVVPESVTRIETGAFAYNRGIEKIEFNNSGENLTFGSKVFASCEGLKEITLPKGMTVIGESMFEGCTTLEKVYIPNTVVSIQQSAFRKCGSLKTVEFEQGGTDALIVEDGASAGGPPVNYGAFSGTYSLKEITFPERTTRIGNFAFAVTDLNGNPEDPVRQTGLRKINLPSTLKEIGNNVFFYSYTLTTVNYAKDIQLESIGMQAFSYAKGIRNLTIPATVKRIGTNAFSGATNLKELVFEAGSQLTEIPGTAFSVCFSLEKIKIPASVKTIGASAFYQCKKLSSVEFEEGIKLDSIGASAFAQTALKSVELPKKPEGETILGNKMFDSCASLISVTIPANSTNIVKALNGCASLKEIIIDGTSTTVKVENSTLSSLDGKNIYYVLPTEGSNEFVIPDGVEEIGDYAFDGKKNIDKVVIPASVKKIGQYAFRNCTNLKTIEFKNKSQSVLNSFGINALENCTSLESIELPDSVTTIGNNAFKGCTSLVSAKFGNKIKTLGTNLFANCSSLESFTIPAGITRTPNYMFQNCTSLKSVEFKGKVTSIGTYFFSGCTSLEEFVVPETVTVLGSATIKNGYSNGSGYVFQNCANLKSVTLPKNLTVIPGGTFKGCSSLTSLEFPENLKAIGISVFEGCTKIDNLVISKDVMLGNGDAPTSVNGVFKNCSSLSNLKFEGTLGYVGREMFYGCTSLKSFTVKGYTGIGQNAFMGSGIESIILPNTVKHIWDSAFMNCDNLTSVSISSSVTGIRTRVFTGCTKLTRIDVDPANDNFYLEGEHGMLFSSSNKLIYCPTYVSGEVTINEGETFDKYAFEDCANITKIVIGSGVTTIPQYAFVNCKKLETVVLPDTVTTIDNYAFSECESLKNIVIPQSVVKIGNYAFKNCVSLTIIDISSVTTAEKSNNFGTYMFYGCTSLKNVTLPTEITSIPTSTFYDCTSLESIVIPEGVTLISTNAFFNCENLKTVVLPSTLVTIQSKAFANCTSLVSIDIPDSVETMNGVFMGCENLTDINISDKNQNFRKDEKGIVYDKENKIVFCPSSVTGKFIVEKGVGLGVYAFDSCSKLTEIVLPEDIESIPEGAFRNCSSLTKLVIPEKVLTIGLLAFGGCTSLESIVIPDNVTMLGANTFMNCESLTSVTFGKGLSALTANCFNGCTSLKEITLPETIITVAATTFAGCNVKVNVPYENEEALPTGLAPLLTADGVTVVYKTTQRT